MNGSPIERFFEYSPEVRIRYRITGNGGRTLLMLHGFGASLETWNDVEPLLPRQWKLIRLDLKGFGLSSKPRDGSYTIFDQAEIVRALVCRLDLKDYVLVGHSYGGTVAMAVYLAADKDGSSAGIRSLVLLDTPCYPQSLPLLIALLRTPVLNRLSQFVTSARSQASHSLSRIFQDKSRLTPERINRYAKYYNLPGSQRSLISCAKQLVPANPETFTARIASVQAPTLIIWGQNDPLIPRWQAERLHAEIKGSRLMIVQDCGHVPHEERPEEVAQILSDFISDGESSIPR